MKTIQKKIIVMLMMAMLVLMGVCPSPASAANEVGRVLLTPILHERRQDRQGHGLCNLPRGGF